jgi:ATP-dependent helicase HrpA
MLNQLRPQQLEWLVPGLLREKIIALLKSLPKHLRRNFVPAPNFADAFLQSATSGEGDLLQALAHHLQRMTGVAVPPDAWQPDQLPDHLRMNVKVVGNDGQAVATGRDLARLQGEQGERAAETFARLPDGGFERERVTAWDFGELPEQVEFAQDGMRLIGYPALVAEDEHVALRLLESAAKAGAATHAGLRRLYALQVRERIKYLEKNLPGVQTLCLHFAGVGDCAGLKADLVNAILERAFIGDRPLPRTAEEFRRNKDLGMARLQTVANELCGWIGEALAEYHAAVRRLKQANRPAWLQSVTDIRDQLAGLIYPGFVTATPYDRLRQLARYLKAVERRLAKLELQPARDQSLLAQIAPLWQAYRARTKDGRGDTEPAVTEFRWLLEELRVSLFAQELKTAVPVSAKRLEKQWAAITAGR